MALAGVTNTPPARIPFRVAARQHVTRVGEMPFTPGQKAQPMLMPTIGWAGTLFISIRGQIVAGGTAPAFKNLVEQAWNLLQRIQVNGNGGLANIVDISGFDAYLESHFRERGFKMDAPGVGSSANDYMIVNGTSPAANQTINNFALTYMIPLSANNGLGFETGLIGFQAKDATFTLDLSFANLGDIWTNAPTFNNTRVEVVYQWYENPDINRVDLPMPQVVRLWSVEKPLVDSENFIRPTRGGTLFHAIIAAKANGVYDSKIIQTLGIKLDEHTTVYDQPNWSARLINRFQLGVDLPEGVTAFDFYHSTQSVSEGDARDMFDLSQYATFDIRATVPTGTVTDAPSSRLRGIFRTRHNLVG